jgi:hypothetical protein
MADVVHELLFHEANLLKLGRRRISEAEARQLPWNSNDVKPNPRGPRQAYRRLLVGETDGGRALTLVIERTQDPTDWIVITGWETGRG